MKKPKFTDAQYVEDCIKAMQNICTTYCTGIPTTIKEVIGIINTLSPLHITTSKLLLEHNMVHEDGTHIVIRNGKPTKKHIPTYKFRPVLERPHARAFVLAVLQEKYKESQKKYEQAKNYKKGEVDIEELNDTLDELLEETKEAKEEPTTLEEFIEKEPVSFNFFHTTEPSLEEAIRIIKKFGGTVTF